MSHFLQMTLDGLINSWQNALDVMGSLPVCPCTARQERFCFQRPALSAVCSWSWGWGGAYALLLQLVFVRDFIWLLQCQKVNETKPNQGKPKQHLLLPPSDHVRCCTLPLRWASFRFHWLFFFFFSTDEERWGGMSYKYTMGMVNSQVLSQDQETPEMLKLSKPLYWRVIFCNVHLCSHPWGPWES